MKIRTFLYLFALLPTLLSARKVIFPQIHPDYDGPWLTGPLLTPSGLTVPAGHYNIEPYLYTIANTGNYDHHGKVQKTKTFWNNSFQPVLQFGLTSWLDIQCAPIFLYNYHDGAASWAFGDLPVGFDIQLYSPHTDEWLPFIKLVLKELFPTGKYEKLDPAKKGTDAGGDGSYNTSMGLAFGKLIHISNPYFMTLRLYFQYSLPAPVRVKGFNAYGGAADTDARIFPSQNFIASFGTEITLAKNWAFALDAVWSWAKKNDFTGNPGIGDDLQPGLLETGPAVQYSLAPAIEYNWNANLGIIAGSWFTVAGRSAPQFYSGIFALNYYH